MHVDALIKMHSCVILCYKRANIMIDERLLKGITSQALDDFLRFRLGKPLVCPEELEEEDLYFDAVQYLARRPAIVRELNRLTPRQLEKLLTYLEDKIWKQS